MKIRNKNTGSLGSSNDFNIHGMSEIVVYFEDGDCDSDFIKNYDVYIKDIDEWVDMHEALKQYLIVTDNYNTTFREPRNQGEKQRGWYY